jgi:hypothetical protein
MRAFWAAMLIFCVLWLDKECFMRAVKRAGTEGSFWQGFCPGSGFYFWLWPHRLRRPGGER